MKIEVPKYPAYLVCHGGHDKGAMEVWLCNSIAIAKQNADRRQQYLDEMGVDGCFYRAYEKLPRRRVFKLHWKVLG